MQAFHRFLLIAGAMLLAGCATDGSSFLNSADPAAPVAEETEAPPPSTSAPTAAHSTPARSTTAAKPPRQAEKDKRTARKPEKKPAPAADQASAPAAAPAGAGKAFAGTWQFSNGQKACMMTLSGGGSGGSVSASGDCWNAYAKAKGWKLQGNDMVLTDGKEPIARMQSTGATRYDGYGAEGEPVVLVR
jgi:hypothetical protein